MPISPTSVRRRGDLAKSVITYLHRGRSNLSTKQYNPCNQKGKKKKVKETKQMKRILLQVENNNYQSITHRRNLRFSCRYCFCSSCSSDRYCRFCSVHNPSCFVAGSDHTSTTLLTDSKYFPFLIVRCAPSIIFSIN